MTGGTQSEFSYDTYNYNIEEIQTEAETIAEHRNIGAEVINSVSTYKISGENMFVVEAGFNKNLDEKELEEHKIFFRNELESNYKNI
jgi:hypothetical protein